MDKEQFELEIGDKKLIITINDWAPQAGGSCLVQYGETVVLANATMSQKNMEGINKDMMIGDAVAKHPAVAEVLTKFGLHCVGCHVNTMESIEEGAKGHGMTDETITQMVEEVNKAISSAGSDFSMTDTAAAKIKQFVEEKDRKFLRIRVVSGGCSGNMYDFSVTNDRDEGDSSVQHAGAEILIDAESMKKLSGSQLDYVDGMEGAGFKIQNPNASGGCGCGKSWN